MESRYNLIDEIVAEDAPTSVRHTYYRAYKPLFGQKDSGGSRSIYTKIQRAILQLRRAGRIPYSHIVDSTRWMRRPTTYTSVEDALAETARTYRRDLWERSEYRVEVWCESESIAGVLIDATWEWGVPLMPTRGQSSETFAWSAAEAWLADDRIPVVIFVGDLDPAGLEIEGNLRSKLTKFYGDGFLWRREGVNIDQIIHLDLFDTGTVPKKPYPYELAWEAEVLPAPYLRGVVAEAIQSYADDKILKVLRETEMSERDLLQKIVATARGAA